MALTARGAGTLTGPAKRCDLAHLDAAVATLKHNETMRARGREDLTVTHMLHLDIDHKHPKDLVQLFERALREKPEALVMSGLNFRRTEPYEPCAFVNDAEGNHNAIAQWTPGIVEVDVVGAASLCMSVDVFKKLRFPWFAYEYPLPDYANWPECTIDDLIKVKFAGPDITFSNRCKEAGVQIYVDTRITSPHMAENYITPQTWHTFQESPQFKWGRNVYQTRLAQLKETVGEIFTPQNNRDILYVGANKWRQNYARELKAAGWTLHLLEIDPANALYNANTGLFASTFCGSIVDSIQGQYDTVFWWHGPEHVAEQDLQKALRNLEIATRPGGLVIVGAPWGRTQQGPEYGNEHERHQGAVYPEHLEALGYSVSVGGQKDSMQSGLVAWKRVE